VLIDRRVHAGQSIRTHQLAIRKRKAELLSPILLELGLAPTARDLEWHVRLGQTDYGDAPPEAGFLAWAESWLVALREAGVESGYAPRNAMETATSYFWMLACRAAMRSQGAPRALKAFSFSPLTRDLISPRAMAWAAQAVSLVAAAAVG
jgi:hypothetical protein